MSNKTMFSLFVSLVFSLSLNSQLKQTFTDLEKVFSNYEILDLNSDAVFQEVKNARNGNEVEIKVNENITWKLMLQKSEIISSNYILTESTENGIVRSKGATALPMNGYVMDRPGSRVSITFNEGFIYGYISFGTTTYFIEPLYHYVINGEKNKFVLYSNNDIKPTEEKKCGYDQYIKETEKVRTNQNHGTRMPGSCLLVEYVTASDFSMFQNYGGSSGVQNHNIGVLNNVQTNYDDEFADELRFQLTEQWVSTCNTCDPWTSSTDAGDLLDAFTSWGVSGFSASHNVGTLWTRRDFNGSTIGLAWVGVICTPNRYHVLQDFSTNAQLKRVLMAHEIGHNFDASHNTGIMAPSVSTATNWSATSISEIQAHYNGASCLGNCPGGTLPTPDFIYTLIDPCSPASVQFTNLSANATSYLWTFDGGTPATSTLENPLVTFTTGGIHNVTLEVTNNFGTNNITLPITVNLQPDPVANFVYTVNGHVVNFIFTGIGGSNYTWDFGDGSNTSSVQNPTHIYPLNGTYTVTLNILNGCGDDEITQQVEISVIPFVNFSANVTSGCQPQNIAFTNLSTNATSYLWTFPGGTPSTSTLQNPVVMYNTPGVFSVTLESTNNTGTNTHFKADYINIQPLPVPGFSVSLNGSAATFSNSSQFSNSVFWNFGDGNTSTSTNPIHNYTNNGTYSVSQIVTNACGSQTLMQNIGIAIPPVVSFSTTSSGTVCTGQSVSFQNNSTFGPNTYLWTFEGGTPSTSTDQNPTVSYNTSGTYDVTLVATNSFGTSQSFLQDYVNVNEKPSVTFTHIGDGLEVTFTQIIINGTNFEWDFGDGTLSNLPNPIHTYSSQGTYLVKLTDSNNCGTTIYSKNILVQIIPTAAFTANTTNTCIGTNIQFTNQSSPSVTSWLWDFEGGTPSTSTLQNPVVTYSQPGIYDVTLTVNNATGTGTTTLSDYIIINDVPNPTFSVGVNSNILQLENTGTGTGFVWTVYNDQINETINNSPATFNAPSNGVYNVFLTSTNMCGQTISDTLQYSINAYPVSVFGYNNGNGACAGQSVVFINNSQNSSTYQWTFENGNPSTSNDQNPTIVFANPGNYDVSLVTTNNLGADTVTTTISVGSIPSPSFNSQVNSNNVIFNYTGSGQSSLLWNFGDGSTSTLENPNHTYANGGTYSVVLIASNGCGNDTIQQNVVIIISSSDDQLNNRNISVYPNPSDGILNISLINVNYGDYTIKLVNVIGQQVLKKSLKINSSIYLESINVSDFNEGMYLLEIEGPDFKKSSKIVIKK